MLGRRYLLESQWRYIFLSLSAISGEDVRLSDLPRDFGEEDLLCEDNSTQSSDFSNSSEETIFLSRFKFS